MVCSLNLQMQSSPKTWEMSCLPLAGIYLTLSALPLAGFPRVQTGQCCLFFFSLALELTSITTDLNTDKSLDKNIVHFSHQLNNQVCSAPCLCPLTNVQKQQSGRCCKWAVWIQNQRYENAQNMGTLNHCLNPLTLGYVSHFVYWYRKKNLTSNGSASSRLLAHSSSQGSRNNSSFDIMNDSALA